MGDAVFDCFVPIAWRSAMGIFCRDDCFAGFSIRACYCRVVGVHECRECTDANRGFITGASFSVLSIGPMLTEDCAVQYECPAV
jgi:hypothetical protein